MKDAFANVKVISLGNECGRNVLFVPKIVRKLIVRVWDDMDERSINDSGLLSFPLVSRNKDPPRTSICVSVVGDMHNVIDVD